MNTDTKAAPTVTTEELYAVDNMLLAQIKSLADLGAQDFADQRRNLRLRVLAILEVAVEA